jgi:hypothetical protein
MYFRIISKQTVERINTNLCQTVSFLGGCRKIEAAIAFGEYIWPDRPIRRESAANLLLRSLYRSGETFS